MSAPWWETYDDRAPMSYPRRDYGPTKRIALTTEPELRREKNGGLRLHLRNRHPHTAVRIFTTRVGCARP